MREPIIVLGTPRSGSSMTAGIFTEHGVWAGTCRGATKHNAKGHFENVVIKRTIIQTQGAIVTEGRLAQQLPGFKTAVLTAIADDGYTGGDWLWKGSALYWPAFYEFHPKWVTCKRPNEQIFASCRSSRIFGRYLSDERLMEIIKLHRTQMDYLKSVVEVFEVDTYEVAQGNYDSIELALAGCGVEPKYELIDSFVDGSLWQHE